MQFQFKPSSCLNNIQFILQSFITKIVRLNLYWIKKGNNIFKSIITFAADPWHVAQQLRAALALQRAYLCAEQKWIFPDLQIDYIDQVASKLLDVAYIIGAFFAESKQCNSGTKLKKRTPFEL